MTIQIKAWDEWSHEELRSFGNGTIIVNEPGDDEDETERHYLACAWTENPQTGSLTLHRLVKVPITFPPETEGAEPEAAEEMIRVELRTFERDAWAGVELAELVFDPENVAQQALARRQAQAEQEEAAKAQAAQAALQRLQVPQMVAPAPNRAQRRAR